MGDRIPAAGRARHRGPVRGGAAACDAVGPRVTPSSSVHEGVAFAVPAPGRLRIDVRTPLYAVSGHSVRPSCEPPADAPSPEGCHLLRPHRAPLRLTLAVPFRGSELQ